MKTKILLCDLDATLFDDKKRVSDEDLGSINEMIDAGHRFVIATGRPLYSAKVVSREIGLFRDGIILLSSNGAVIYDCATDKVIARESLPLDVVDDLFRAALSENLSIHTYTDDNVVSEHLTREIRMYTSVIKMPFAPMASIPRDLPEPPPKLIVMSAEENSREILIDFEARHAAMVGERAESVFSNDHLLEYLPVGVSKGTGLRTVCSLLDIPLENSIAAGDEANDIPMIVAAGVGAVMKNGTDEAKSHADYVTKRTNNESGVSEIIRKFVF